jgi:apolipoprotein N-acyltransferase
VEEIAPMKEVSGKEAPGKKGKAPMPMNPPEEQATPPAGFPITAEILLSVSTVLLIYLSFRPADQSWLVWFCLVPWLVLIRRARFWRATLFSSLIGFSWFFLCLSWLSIVTWPGLLATCFIYIFYNFAFFAAVRIVDRRLRIPFLASVPFFWICLEFLRSTQLFYKFPWVQLGHTQYANRLLLQIVDITSAYGISFIIVSVNAWLADACLAVADRGWRKGLKVAAWEAAVPVLLIAVSCGYGYWRLSTIELAPGPKICVVQGNVPQELKEQEDLGPDRLDYHMGLSKAALGKNVDMVVWPETMLPGLLDRDRGLQYFMAKLARNADACLLLGGFHVGGYGKNQTFHNSAFYMSPKGALLGRYDKINLVPISEYLPFQKTWPWLSRQLKNMVPPEFVSFEPGKDIVVFEVGGFRFAPFICFEISFPELIREAFRRDVDFLVVVSNDAWFKDSVELELARDMTIFRAVEGRRGIVRCVNTGISGFFDPLGNVIDLEVKGKRKQVEGVLIEHVMTSGAGTFYLQHGDLFSHIVLLLSGCLLVLGIFLKRG